MEARSETVVLEGSQAVVKRSPIDAVREFLTSEGFRPFLIPLVLFFVALFAMFWPMIETLPHFWFADDGYYSHGILVPLIAGYIVYRNWDRYKVRPANPSWFALLLLPMVLMMTWAADLTRTNSFWTAGLIMFLYMGAWFVLGWPWLKNLFMPIGYLVFGLPFASHIIQSYTINLQVLSTEAAYHFLRIVGLNPFQESSTVIHLDNFVLDVAVPCSGLKLLVAMTAFSVLFILVARLRWWGNLMMLAIILPLSVLINGLRVGLIGIVGNQWGPDAGVAFHDYSGYITLIICFFLLFKFARILGWKD